MDVMLDFETLGTGHNAVICSAGLVRFNIETGEVLDSYSLGADLESALAHGRVIDSATLQWWLAQDDAARKALAIELKYGSSWRRFLSKLVHYIHSSGSMDELRLWSNGATFDIVLLESALKDESINVGWSYRAHRDMRTLVDIAKPFRTSVVREGVQHDALVDARYQAAVVSELWRHVKGIK